MDSVIVLGIICIGQALYAYHLINKLSRLVTILAILKEGLIKVADGEVRIVRTAEGVQFEMVKEV